MRIRGKEEKTSGSDSWRGGRRSRRRGRRGGGVRFAATARPRKRSRGKLIDDETREEGKKNERS
jgi:hypothetical protein